MFRFVISLLLIIGATAVYAFDGDVAINEPDLNLENFLDLKSFELNPFYQFDWYDVENGLRVSGGSLSSNDLALDNEFRYKNSFSESADVRVQWLQQQNYAIKPTAAPQLEVAMHPWQAPFEFSLLGTPTYDKRSSDLGFALAYGLRPRDYVRLTWLSQDFYYNSKNTFDESRYERKPRNVTLAVDYGLGGVRTRLQISKSNELKFIQDDGLPFSQNEQRADGSLDYPYADKLIGVKWRISEEEKKLAQSADTTHQTLRYWSVDFYWARRATNDLSVGLRLDQFTNCLSALVASDYDYRLQSSQLYVTWQHPFDQMAWDVGFYAGPARANKNYRQADVQDERDDNLEAKLQLGWQYRSAKGAILSVDFSINADALASDAGDGGVVKYQSHF